jgi:formylglycine-generating enzyme required for sulfatase activity
MGNLFYILVFGLLTCAEVTLQAAPQIETTPSGIKMVLIKGGAFKMGSAMAPQDANTVHDVNVSDFYMDIHEVTQEDYTKLMDLNPSRFIGDKYPVERIRWTDAARYCNARSQKEGLKPCYDTKSWKCDFSANGYRLPTEAEWEYACRGGTKGEYFFGGGIAKLDLYVWYRDNSREKTHPVATKLANPYGLYDIIGNVAEWCNDYYDNNYYKVSLVDNPKGPEKSNKKVLRGGSWRSRSKYCNVYKRSYDDPATADICQGYDNYGFRCVKKTNGKVELNSKDKGK